MSYPRINRIFINQSNLIFMLFALTLLSIGAQISFFIIHYQVFDLYDALAASALSSYFLHNHLLLPILFFISIQCVIYLLLIGWITFQTFSIQELLQLSKFTTYGLGIALWLATALSILSLNHHYYPHSFFAQWPLLETLGDKPLFIVLPTLLFSNLLAYSNTIFYRRRIKSSTLYLIITLLVSLWTWHDQYTPIVFADYSSKDKPNIIFISIDSGRPDFINAIDTPHLHEFMATAKTFTQAYTPLARSFPAWVSVLTGRYPKHHQARANLTHASELQLETSLPQQLKTIGYETWYGADETRFANINEYFGFDHLIGIRGSAVEFLLAGLSDTPVTNLLVNLPIGRFLFPYSYGNRAAAITYQPDKFLHLVKLSLNQRAPKPTFLALHLCLAHWPFLWADASSNKNVLVTEQYRRALRAADTDFKQLLSLLKKAGLLQNSIVVLLSDHGVGLGLAGDRIIKEKNYFGKKEYLSWITRYPLSSAKPYSLNFKEDFPLNTSYGQGTDVLSLTQYRVLLAFKSFSQPWPAGQIPTPSLLLDIAPTILDLLKIKPKTAMDGLSLKAELENESTKPPYPRAIFIETGDKMAEIESAHINVNDVVKKGISAYQIDTHGALYLTPDAIHSIILNKQRAIIFGDWLLARYPTEQILAKTNLKSLAPKIIPSFFILVNLRTQQWTISPNNPQLNQAPIQLLTQKLEQFYTNELFSKTT